MKKLFIDIETNGLSGKDGDLLLTGWAVDDGEIHVENRTDLPLSLLVELADEEVGIVSHSTFDPKWLTEAEWNVGGPIFDTKVMAATLNENTPLDLDWLTHRYARIDMDKRLKRHSNRIFFVADDGQEYALDEWEQWYGTDVWEQFRDYNFRDVAALRELYYELEMRLQEAEWEPHWLREEVPYTRVLMDMEGRGLPVDLEATAKLAEEIEAEVVQLRAELLFDAGLPESFNLNSQKQLVAYLFSRQAHLAESLPLGADAAAVVKSCLDGEHEFCDYYKDPYNDSPTEVDAAIRSHAKDWLPEGFVLEKLGREVAHGYWSVKGRGLSKTPPPVNPLTGEEGKLPSTSSPILLYIHGDDEWVQKLCMRYRKGEKLLTTYLRKFPKIARPDERGQMRLHGRFNQTGTVTGRLSSSDPNLQNIPARGARGKQVRDLFRVEEGYLIIADYDQLEMRIMASLSGDPRLLKVFRDGDDPHILLAHAIFGESIDPFAIAPGAAASYRDAGKQLNYAMGYGAGPKKVAQTLSLMGFPTPVETARGYLGEMERFYHVLFRWINGRKAYARAKGTVRTLGGRRRRLKGAFKDQANWKMVGYGERQAVNSIVQGTAADVIRLAMLELDADLSLPRMIAQVHDELLFFSLEEPSLYVPRIQEIGQTAYTSRFELQVPLVFEPHVGKSWGDKSGTTLDMEILADEELEYV